MNEIGPIDEVDVGPFFHSVAGVIFAPPGGVHRDSIILLLAAVKCIGNGRPNIHRRLADAFADYCTMGRLGDWLMARGGEWKLAMRQNE